MIRKNLVVHLESGHPVYKNCSPAAKPPLASNGNNIVAAVDEANISAVPPATTGKNTI